MLRLLKGGDATTLPDVATLVGYSPRHVQRWWQVYRTAGLVALERVYHPAGKPAQLTEEAWLGLAAELEAGRIGGQEDARRYLAEQWGVEYRSVNGISYQFKRRKVKWKTGRRRHAKADAAAQAAFKQTSPLR
jgi:transposase